MSDNKKTFAEAAEEIEVRPVPKQVIYTSEAPEPDRAGVKGYVATILRPDGVLETVSFQSHGETPAVHADIEGAMDAAKAIAKSGPTAVVLEFNIRRVVTAEFPED